MIRKDLGKKLKSLRKEREITQAQIAEDTGMRISHISLIENGHANFQIDYMLKYCNYLGIKIKLF